MSLSDKQVRHVVEIDHNSTAFKNTWQRGLVQMHIIELVS